MELGNSRGNENSLRRRVTWLTMLVQGCMIAEILPRVVA